MPVSANVTRAIILIYDKITEMKQHNHKLAALLLVIVLTAIAGAIVYLGQTHESGDLDPQPTQYEDGPTIDESNDDPFDDIVYTHSAILLDVSNGNIGGIASAVFENGTYRLLVIASNLPKPAEGYQYIGLLTNQDTGKATSVGMANQDGDDYTIKYSSTSNLLDHTKLTLVLSPKDAESSNNSAPVLEGALSQN